MNRFRLWLSRAAGLFAQRRRDIDLAREFDAHLQFETEDLIRQGHSPEEAGRIARLHAGAIEAAKEAYRDQRSVPLIESVRQTVRQAAASLRRGRRYALAVIASFALGVGANTAMFTVTDAVLRRPLPYPDSSRILTVGVTNPSGVSWELFPPDVNAWSDSGALKEFATFSAYPAVVAGDADTEFASGGFGSPRLLAVLGFGPLRGRWFTTDDTQRGAPRVVVLSQRLWQRQFAGDPQVLGRSLRVYGQPHVIVGVLPDAYGLPLGADFWLPRSPSDGQVIFRPQPGTTVKQLHDELERLSPGIANLRRRGQTVDLVVTPLQDQLFGSAAPALKLLLGATGLLLLIACANAANLSLARALDRRREWAVRVTLGATRRSLAWLVIAENLLLGVAGGTLGLLAAHWTSQLFARIAPDDVRLPAGIRLDGIALLFASVSILVSVLAASVAPAWAVTRGDIQPSLGDSGARQGRGGRARTARRGLIIVQLATGMVLLIGAGLMVRSLARLNAVDLGFDTKGVIAASVNLVGPRYRDPARTRELAERLNERLSSLPGVDRVSFGPVPLVGGRKSGLREGFSALFVGPSNSQGIRPPMIWAKYVSPGYFETFGIPVRSGRPFAATDDANAAAVALVNATAAKMYFGDSSPIDRILNAPKSLSGGRAITVVGVTADVRQRDVTMPAEPEIFVPLSQQAWNMSELAFAVRSNADPGTVMTAVRRVLKELDPDLATTRLSTMKSVVDASLARYQFLLVLFGALAGLAMALAIFGLYAVVSYLVTQRTREIGVRMALGAGRGRILALVGKEVSVLMGVGACLGLGAALVLADSLRAFLFEVQPRDLEAFAMAPLLLAGAAFLSAYLPIRRALTLDPALVLRAD